MQFVLGVDEAGRGPLAGPVAVGVVALPLGFDVAKEFPGVKDSKQLSEKKRERIFDMLVARVALGDARYRVEFESADHIDCYGIVPSVRSALYRGIDVLAPDAEKVDVWLDGALTAPPEYRQHVVIRGDSLIPIISLASIAAKVTRDRAMCELAREYPAYGFEIHKGYGTKAHYEALTLRGVCAIHRRTFIHID